MAFISITIVRSIGWTYNTTTSTTYLLFFKITLEGGVLIWEIKSPKVFRFQFQLEKNLKFSGTKFRGGRKISDFRFQKFWFLYILFQMVYPIIKHSWGGWTASTWPPGYQGWAMEQVPSLSVLPDMERVGVYECWRFCNSAIRLKVLANLHGSW